MDVIILFVIVTAFSAIGGSVGAAIILRAAGVPWKEIWKFVRTLGERWI